MTPYITRRHACHLGVGLLASAASLIVASCAKTDQDSTGASSSDAQNAQDPQNLQGNISLAGSTSMEKMCEALSEGFMNAYPNVHVSVEYTGSSAGIESLQQNLCDIANSSRELSEAEKASGIVGNVVALDGIAVIVNKENTCKNLTTDQLKQIFTRSISSWSDVGGSNAAIVVIGRENASGTRSAFEELVGVKNACAYAQELDSTGAVLAKVASTPGAIGYISFDAISDAVHALALDGVDITEDAIASQKYPLVRPFIMATKGEVSAQSSLVQAWFSYIASDEGIQTIKSAGVLPASAAPSAKSSAAAQPAQ